MSSSNQEVHGTTQRPAEMNTAIDPDNVDLFILSPSPEVLGLNNGRMVYLKTSLDTTISQLKDRIQNDLPARPTPQQQRLIYRGRPLLNTHTTLRQILRGQQNPSDFTASYTLHLVLPPSQSGNAPAGSEPTVAHPATSSIPLPPNAPAIPPVHPPQMAHLQLLLGQVQGTQQTLQQQLDGVHQQLVANNLSTGPVLTGPPPPNSMQITYQMGGGPTPPMSFPPGFFPAGPNLPHLQEMLGRQQAMRAAAGMNAAFPHSHVPGDQQATGHVQTSQNSPDAPTTRVQESIGPNGERIRTYTQEMHVRTPRQGTPVASERAVSTAENRSSTPDIQTHPPDTGINRSNSRGNHAMQRESSRGIHRHLPYPFVGQQPLSPNTAAQTTAWLLSSPSGPQALLFAPGHGYFASPSPQTTARLTPSRSRLRGTPTPANHIAIGPAQGASNSSFTVPPANDANPNANQLALQQQQQAQVPQNRNRNGQDENEILGNIAQRGWLFLRLYMFTFVLSEAGTWRRWLLLALAIFTVLLPRENPFSRMIAAVRRHFDNLIGPPAPRPEPQAAAAPGNSQAARQQATTTPEEAVTRLVREHQERNPSVLRDTLFRIERALALFLASLVPGVGERHVRAREEARRLEHEERERERVSREAELAVAASDSNQGNTSRDGEKASETGIGVSEAGDRGDTGNVTSSSRANNIATPAGT